MSILHHKNGHRGKMTPRRWLAGHIIALAATTAAPALADCNVFPFAVSQPPVERFAYRPESLLADYRDGGPGMANRVLIISASSRTVRPALLNLVRSGNIRQRQSIAQGLALAAKICATRSATDVRMIEAAVQKMDDPVFQREFRLSYRAQIEANEQANNRPVKPPAPPAAPETNIFFGPASTAPVQRLGDIPSIRSIDQLLR